jgi:endoglucanase
MPKWSGRYFYHWLDQLNDQQSQPSIMNWQRYQFHRYVPPTDPTDPPTTPNPPTSNDPPPNNPGVLTLTPASNASEGTTVSAGVTDADGLGTVSYQWQKQVNGSWQAIAGATGKDYLVGYNDGGSTLRVLANYTDAKGHAESLQKSIAAIDVDRPGTLTVDSSTGQFAVGAKVTAHLTDPDGFSTAQYQWSSRDPGGQWQNIAGATAQSYTLTAADAGKEIDVTATYTDSQGHTTTVADPFTVAAPPAPTPAPNTSGVLTITTASGGALEGSKLTAGVTDADGLGAVSYQWQKHADDGTWQAIAGATSQSYTIGYSDGGHDLRVLATYTDQAGHAESLQKSIATIDVDRPGTLTVDSSTGTFAAGAQVTAHISDPDGVGTATYQWASMGTDGQWHNINGATGQSYTLTAADAGKQIDVTANYVDLQGHNSTVADPFTVAAPAPTPTPTPTGPNAGEHFLLGVNLSGAEFGSAVPGVYNQDYTYPTHAEIDYYASKGMEVIRLPFLWERVQPTENGPLSTAELARIDDVVNYAASKGLMVDLDVHNYGKGYGSLIGSAATPNSAFADLWGKLATHFADDSNVIFGLMNEPNQQSAAQWLDSANSAIAAIRAAGATQEILVPGSYWDGGWTWVSSDNDTVIGTGVKDPLNNYAFEVHQYLDSDGSGSHSNVVSATAGVDRLQAITQWAEANGAKLFLGEFGVATDTTSLQALDGMVNYMSQHPVWQGATYWAGGPWWGNYMYSIEVANGVDKPQMGILEKYTTA